VALAQLAWLLAVSAAVLPAPTAARTRHWIEAEAHRGVAVATQPVFAGRQSPLIPRDEPTITRGVYGYAPYWVDDRWLHYDLLTRIGLFDVTLNPDGSITNGNNFPGRWAAVIDRAHRNGVKCEMVATCFGWSNIHGAIRAPGSIPNLVALAESAGVDGINMDFEDILPADRDTMVLFMQALSRACRAAGLELTMATMPLDQSNAYDFRALADTTDGLFIMGYNFHWQGGPEAGPVAPLTGWPYYGNLQMTLNEYLSEIGSGRKLYFGLPYYGYQWPTQSDTTHASTAGYGEALYYKDAPGRAQSHGQLWDGESQTPWYRFSNGGWNQGWYDNDTSLLLKYQEAHEHDMIGTGMWALGYDGARTELWAALREAFNRPLDAFTNGDCESWSLDTLAVPTDTSPNAAGWYEGRKAKYRRESATVHSGTSSIRHIPDSLGFDWPVTSVLFQDVAVLPDTRYELSGWSYKNDGRNNCVKLVVQWYDSTHRLVSTAASAELAADSAGWRRLSTGDAVPPARTAFARLCLWMEGRGGFDFWDDLSFTASTGVAEETPNAELRTTNAPTIVRGVLVMPEARGEKREARSELLDISGRKVLDLQAGANDISRLAPGVYFVRAVSRELSAVSCHKVLVQK
jgi:hypothetical protein